MSGSWTYSLINYAGLAGLGVLGAGLVAIWLQWRWESTWWFRLSAIAFGAGCGAVVLYLSTLELHILSYFYLILIGMFLVWHIGALFVALARIDWSRAQKRGQEPLHPLLRRAISAERALDFAGAVKAYDEYLEEAGPDAAVLARLGEVLIKAGNTKRALSVLTLAFTEAEEPRLKIAFGVRLAELILVARRDPIAARAQLEQIRMMFAGTEHEEYVDALAAEMTKRVGEGWYQRGKPPHTGPPGARR